MAILSIVTEPDPILKQISLPVYSVDQEIRNLMSDMLETMYHDNGVGLAAVQIGVLKRVITIDLQSDDESRSKDFYPLFMANPRILRKSEELVLATEGCLSLPGQRVELERPAAIAIEFLDYNNKKQILDADGWLARVVQHEMDHLDGRLLIYYLSNVKRDIALRKLTKLKKGCL